MSLQYPRVQPSSMVSLEVRNLQRRYQTPEQSLNILVNVNSPLTGKVFIVESNRFAKCDLLGPVSSCPLHREYLVNATGFW